MRVINTLVLTLVVLAGCAPGNHPHREAEARDASPDAPESGSRWFVVGRGDLATIEVDRCLYERPDDDQFYVRTRVQSLAEQDIGVDLRDADLVPSPNQWGSMREPQRTVIDERRLALEDRVDELAARAVEGLHAGELDELSSGQTVEFYRPFNAGGVGEIKGLDGPDARHLFVSFDGVVPVAVSTVAELVRAEASLIVTVPVCWSSVPAGARIIAH